MMGNRTKIESRCFVLLLLLLALFSVASAFVKQNTFATRRSLVQPASGSSDTCVYLSAAPRDENLQAESLAKTQQENWRDARIVTSRPACPSGKSTYIELQVDAATRKEYTIPGQFVQFRYKDAEPIFLAIASAPDAENFEFLIKMAPRLTWLPEALVEGNTVQVSQVMGNGFPLTDLTTNTVESMVLVAAGSGIAPLKACIESGQLPCSPNNKLYYGEWKRDDLCFTELYDGWKSNLGIDLVPALSRIDDTTGYVQSLLEQDGVAAPETTGAILCGMDDMVESCTAVLTEAGVKKENILLNL